MRDHIYGALTICEEQAVLS